MTTNTRKQGSTQGGLASRPRLSLAVAVVPAFGCEGTIASTVEQLARVGLETLVVSDGSRDRTVARARAAGAHVLGQPANHGKGSALAAGFAEALRLGADHVITLDGDGQHAPADAPALVEAARRSPRALVIGRRSFEPSVMPRRSIIGNRSSAFWLKFFAGDAATADVQCGYRVYPRWLLERHPPESRRFAVETELLLRTIRAGAEVVYVPVSTIYKEGAGSHFRVWPDTLPVCVVALRSLFW